MKDLLKLIKRHKYQTLLFLIILLGIVLRLYSIGSMDLWRDEAFSVNVAFKNISNIITITINDTQPPLHILLLHFWIKLFGSSEVSVRLPSLIFGIITIIYVYKLSKFAFKDEPLALLTTFISAINPLLIVYSQEARSYSLFTSLSVISIYYFLKIDVERNILNYILFITSSLLGLYTHNLFLVLIFSYILIIFKKLQADKLLSLKKLIFKKNKQLDNYLIAFFVIFIIYIPWVYAFIQQIGKVENEGFWLIFDPIKSIIDTSIWFFTSAQYQNTNLFDYILHSLISIIGIALTSFSLIHIYKSREQDILKYLLIIFSTSIIAIYIISFKYPFFYIRYLIFLCPLVLIFMANGVNICSKKINKRIVILIITIFTISNIFYYFYNISAHITKPEFKMAVNSITYDSSTDIILHPTAKTYHNFILYSTLPSYIYDPQRKLPYYEGLAYITSENYYDGDISKYDRIWSLSFEKNQSNYDFENLLNSKGYIKYRTQIFKPDLYIELWTKQK